LLSTGLQYVAIPGESCTFLTEFCIPGPRRPSARHSPARAGARRSRASAGSTASQPHDSASVIWGPSWPAAGKSTRFS